MTCTMVMSRSSGSNEAKGLGFDGEQELAAEDELGGVERDVEA